MYGDLYNLEATPAESTTYRFAKHDRERYPTSSPQRRKETPRTTPTARTCLSATPTISSPRSTFRTISRRATPPAPSSTPSSAKNCLTGAAAKPRAQDRRELRAAILHPFSNLLRLQSTTATSAASISPALSAASLPRSTAASPATIAQCRTGTPVRPRSTRSARNTSSITPCSKHNGPIEETAP